MVIALYGVLKAGGAYMPLDPEYPAERLAHMLEISDSPVLLVQERLRSVLPDYDGCVISLDAQWGEIGRAPRTRPAIPTRPEHLAYVIFTSGSTGRPKGVFFTQRQLTLHTLAVTATVTAFGNYGGIDKHDIYMPLTPMFHVHAWGIPYLSTMLGLKQVYPGKYEPPMLMKLIVGEKVTFSHCVPTILQMIVNAPGIQKVNLSGWKVVIGGARLPKGLALDATKLGIQVYAGYGMSETCPVLTIANLKPAMEEEWTEEAQLDKAISTGFPIPLVKLRVTGADGERVAQDAQEAGEIQVRTPWLTQAYYKDPEQTEALWEGGWLHTGDVANVDEHGYVQIVDRMKDLIKSGGEWIVSLELENLLSLHDDVLEAAVIGVYDEKWGERPLAIVVPKAEAKGQLTVDAMQAHLRGFVAQGVIANWAVPDSYVFVDEIPKTSVGKIDKKILRSRYQGQ